VPVIKWAPEAKFGGQSFMPWSQSIVWNALKVLEKARNITGLMADPVASFHFCA
jgi:hypothetical protein